MDPGFHRGDDKAWIPFSTGMTGLRVDFQSTNSEPIGLEPKVVQLLFVLFISQALLNSTPQLLARDRRAVAQSAQLGPGDLRMDATP
jgi:hypothetical protein